MPRLAKTKSGSDASERLSAQFSMPSSVAFQGPRTLPAVLRVLSAWGTAKPDCFRDESGLLQSSSDAGHSSWGINVPVLPWAAAELSCPALHTAGICRKQTATLPSHQFQRPLRFFLHWLNHTLHKSYSHVKTKGFHSFGIRGRHKTYLAPLCLLQLLPIIQIGTAAGAGSRD